MTTIGTSTCFVGSRTSTRIYRKYLCRVRPVQSGNPEESTGRDERSGTFGHGTSSEVYVTICDACDTFGSNDTNRYVMLEYNALLLPVGHHNVISQALSGLFHLNRDATKYFGVAASRTLAPGH
jgi:hypothetical protein